MEDALALTMENVLRNDTICRICLVRGEGMQALFVEGIGIIEQIDYCTGIRLLNEPSLPSHICPPCLTHLSVAHSFKSTCLASHHTLHPHSQTLVDTRPAVLVKMERDDSMDMDNEEWVKEERKSKRMKMKKEKEDRKAKRTQPQPSKHEYIYTENNQTMFVNIGNSFPRPHSVEPRSVSSSSSPPDARLPGDTVLHEKTPKKRCKKGSADASTWEINKVKKAREAGRAYLSQKRLKGVRVGFETRKERKMGPPCYSTLCSPEPPDIKPEKVYKRGPYKKAGARRPKFKFRRLWCSPCQLKFDSKEESDAHRLAKHPEDPWMCEICGKVFTHRGSHYTHVRSHLPPLHGCAHCDYKTWHRHDLVKHLRIHAGVKQYQCTQCARTFHTSSNLASHTKRLHEHARPYQCAQCPRRFFDRTKLRRHTDSHNDIKRFECEVCHSCFTRRCYWKKHLQKQHGVVVPPQRPGRQKVNFLVGEELIQDTTPS